MIDRRENEFIKKLSRYSLNPHIPLPPRNPKSEIRRNYLPLFLLKMPKVYGGIEVDSLFCGRHMPYDGKRDSEKLRLVSNTSFDLPSFLDIGMGTLSENSHLKEKMTKINQEIIMWLDEWVAPKDSPDTNRNKPIFFQAYRKIFKQALRKEDYRERDRIIDDWWESSKFLRFLMGKGSAASIMLNRQNGVETTTLNADLLNCIETQNIADEKLQNIIFKFYQGPDLDFAVFPTDVYHEVFTEFQKRQILRKALGKDAVKRFDLSENETEKFEIQEIKEEDIILPPGFKLKSNKLFCSFMSGRIPQKPTIPYYDIVYSVELINETTGDIRMFNISELSFMPSTVDESTVGEDTRTGTNASLLSQLRGAGIFIVNTHKRRSSTWLEPKDRSIVNETGIVAKLDSSFAEAATLPDRPVGQYLNDMISGEIPFDDGLIATLLGRSLRDGLFNSFNIFSRNTLNNSPFSDEYFQIFRSLSEKFRPEMVQVKNIEEMKMGLIQAWMLDFPLLINFLNNTGFAKHLVMGQNDQMLQAMIDMAQNIKKSPYYESFLTKLIKTKEQSKEGKQAKIDETNLQQMVK